LSSFHYNDIDHEMIAVENIINGDQYLVSVIIANVVHRNECKNEIPLE